MISFCSMSLFGVRPHESTCDLAHRLKLVMNFSEVMLRASWMPCLSEMPAL